MPSLPRSSISPKPACCRRRTTSPLVWTASRATLAEDQVRVTELVPAVAGPERGGIRALDQLPAADGLEHQQVAGVGLVPAGEQPVDGAHAALRGHDHARPARARSDLAIRAGDGL